MNLHMAYRARLVLICLVMKRRRSGRREIYGRRVTLEAHAVHVVTNKQTRIRRPVREMARGAALGLDRWMLVDERARRLDVALGADGILRRADSDEIRLKGAVRVVAISALDQAFVDPVMERLCKSRLYVGMALIAESWLAMLEQSRLCFKLVYAVAAGATYKCFAMGGPLEVGMITNVASQAFLLHLFRRCLCELKDLGRNTAAFNMGLARSVAIFAGHTFAVVFER